MHQFGLLCSNNIEQSPESVYEELEDHNRIAGTATSRRRLQHVSTLSSDPHFFCAIEKKARRPRLNAADGQTGALRSRSELLAVTSQHQAILG